MARVTSRRIKPRSGCRNVRAKSASDMDRSRTTHRWWRLSMSWSEISTSASADFTRAASGFEFDNYGDRNAVPWHRFAVRPGCARREIKHLVRETRVELFHDLADTRQSILECLHIG